MQRMLFFCLFAITFQFISCATPAVHEEQPLAKHVILIGADGFSSAVIRENPDAFPNIELLMHEGSHTLERRSVLPSSSAVNWASMLMGAGPELHGYTTAGSKTPELPSRVVGKRGLFPSVLGLIRDNYPDAVTGCGFSWPTIGCLYEQDAVDFNYNATSEEMLCDSMSLYIGEQKPMFAFIAFDEPDHTGHQLGWETEEYLETCKMIDGFVGKIMDAIREAGMEEETIVIFTADHGGINKGHGGKTMKEMESPFVVYGKGIKRGHYIDESVMVYDCAATIAHIFNIETPQVWIGRPVLSVFE